MEPLLYASNRPPATPGTGQPPSQRTQHGQLYQRLHQEGIQQVEEIRHQEEVSMCSPEGRVQQLHVCLVVLHAHDALPLLGLLLLTEKVCDEQDGADNH